MRGRSLVVCSLVTVSCLAFASVASPASNPSARQGFWIGFGAGYGSAHATCEGCIAGKRENGGVAYLNLGGTLNSTTITIDQRNGVALLAGAGYDFRVWTKASVTLGANFWYGRRFGSTGVGDPDNTWKQNVVDVTLGITFH